jgi:hypothetical protein
MTGAIAVMAGYGTSDPALVYDLDAANFAAVPTNGTTVNGFTLTVANAGSSISWQADSGGVFRKSNATGTDVIYGGPNYATGQSYSVFMAYKLSATASGRLLNTQSETVKDWLMGAYNGNPKTFYPNFSVNLPSTGADTVWHLDVATWNTSTSLGQLYAATNTQPTGTSFTATNGGGGGFNNGNGTAGGSGGGGSYTSSTGGAGTSGQGFAGGNGATSYGGGGGGASAVGGNASGSGGAGGVGAANSISGSSTFYAGGGGGGAGASSGGAGGSGGGGAGVATGNGVAGTANTGGGGGGSSQVALATGGAGGSGVVVLSYLGSVQRATGGTVTTYGTGAAQTWVHTFTTSGTFTA